MHLARAGHDACLWGRDAALVADMARAAPTPSTCPDITFPDRLRVTADLEDALRDTEFVVAAVPSHGTRDILRRAAPFVRGGATVVSATKGLEQDTLFRMSEIIEQELGDARARGRALGAELRGRAGARAADRRVGGVARRGRRRARAGRSSARPYFRLYGTTTSSASRSAAR